LAYTQLQHKLAYIFHKAAIILNLEAIQTVYMETRKPQEQNKVDNTPHKCIIIAAPTYSKQKRITMGQRGKKHENCLMA
jgi:hypothetical protein